ncbi:MAG TPA: hypothetical protein VF719_03975, partial [Abditibacteriaceae bacterium]
MKPDLALTDAERYPLLTKNGQEMLRRLREHPCAPRYNHICGDRMNTAALERVRLFEKEVMAQTGTAHAGAPNASKIPEWLSRFAEFCLADVPFYRCRGGSAIDLQSIPACSREDLSREFWSFVPDSQPLDDMIVYATSGTTGHPLTILSHPETSSRYLPLLRLALARRGITLEGGPSRVSIVLVCMQQSTYTYASLMSYLGEAGFLKINLHPQQWRNEADRARFLDDCAPEIYTGDPISFEELATLPLRTRPKALLSTAMTLLPALRDRLEAHFSCPVIDVYSNNEAGLIAAGSNEQSGHQLLPPDLHVEILRPDDTPCAPGERGEITLSGGRNPFLPLLRYRTGDWASLDFGGSIASLIDLSGRAPTIFTSPAGHRINNIDVTAALKPFALSQFRLHQTADGVLHLQ